MINSPETKPLVALLSLSLLMGPKVKSDSQGASVTYKNSSWTCTLLSDLVFLLMLFTET